MKIKLIFLLTFLFAFNFSFSQKLDVEFIIKNDSLPKKERRDFIYLNKETDISTARYIGRVKASCKLKEMKFAIIFLQDKAQKKGANSFQFVSSQNKNGISEIIIDAYVIDEKIKLQNETFFPKEKIYFFGKNNTEDEKAEEFKVNGEFLTLKPFQFSTILFDQPTTIQKGKALGMTLKIKPQNNGRSFYLNFSGFGAVGGYAGNGGMGVSISGGTITQMDENIALLMTHIFTEKN